MQRNRQKEKFSVAYIAAVVAVAGFELLPGTDVQSDDLQIASDWNDDAREFTFPRIEVQLKCTSQQRWRDGALAFRLSRKNYDDLRKKSILPRLLVVVVVPDNPAQWLEQDTNRLVMRHCAYWVSLHGQPPIAGATTTVRVPATNLFTVVALTDIMNTIARNERP